MSPVRTDPLSVPSKADKITKCPVEQKISMDLQGFYIHFEAGCEIKLAVCRIALCTCFT